MLVNKRFLSGEDFLPEKGLVEKAVTLKSFRYLPLAIQLKKQTSIAVKQYQRFDDGDETKTIKKDDKASPIKKHNRSNLIYNPDLTFLWIP